MAPEGSAASVRSLSLPSSGWELRVTKAKKRLDALQYAGVKPASWNSRDVGDWLEVIGLAQYRGKCIAQGVDGTVLLDLATTCQHQKKDIVIERRRRLEQLGIRNLAHLGIRNLAHQMLFMNKASELKAHEVSLKSDDSILETPGKTKTAALLEQHTKLQHRRNSLKDMQEVLDDLVKQSVFINLQHCVDVLKMEGGSDLVKLSFDCICKLKAKLADCKTKLLEEEKTINSEKVKALRNLDCWGADLLAGVSSPKVSQQKALSKDQSQKLLERLYPDPKKVEEALQKRAVQEEKDWKLRIGMPEPNSPHALSPDQHEKLLGRLHPVPLQKDWKLRIGMKERNPLCQEEEPSKESNSVVSGLEGRPESPVHDVKKTNATAPSLALLHPALVVPLESESAGW